MPDTPPPTQTRHPWRATAGVDTAPAVVQVLGVAAAVTRVMALPGVETWLRRWLPWLATEPKPAGGRTA